MRIVIVAIISVFLVIGGIGVYLAPNDLRECAEVPDTRVGCQKADAIIAISGGDTEARTGEAIMLYQDGWADKVIFSGAAADKTGPSNAEAMRDHALDAGVPAEAILLEEYGETTRQNAERTQALLHQNGIADVILVTSPYHQRRAMLEFERRATDSVQLRSHPTSADSLWSRWWWTTPVGWYLTASELVKIGIFYIGGTR